MKLLNKASHNYKVVIHFSVEMEAGKLKFSIRNTIKNTSRESKPHTFSGYFHRICQWKWRFILPHHEWTWLAGQVKLMEL